MVWAPVKCCLRGAAQLRQESLGSLAPPRAPGPGAAVEDPALQAAPGQWPGPSPGTNSPLDCLCLGSAQVGQDLLDRRPLQDGRDDIQLPGTAVLHGKRCLLELNRHSPRRSNLELINAGRHAAVEIVRCGASLPDELMRFATPSWHSLPTTATRSVRDGEVPSIR
jgi:hypothetical protein